MNIGSVNGIVSPPYFAAYSASKFALEAITDALRMELRRWKIAVAIVEPAHTNTPIWDKSRQHAEHFVQSLPPELLGLYEEQIEAPAQRQRGWPMTRWGWSAWWGRCGTRCARRDRRPAIPSVPPLGWPVWPGVTSPTAPATG